MNENMWGRWYVIYCKCSKRHHTPLISKVKVMRASAVSQMRITPERWRSTLSPLGCYWFLKYVLGYKIIFQNKYYQALGSEGRLLSLRREHFQKATPGSNNMQKEHFRPLWPMLNHRFPHPHPPQAARCMTSQKWSVLPCLAFTAIK